MSDSKIHVPTAAEMAALDTKLPLQELTEKLANANAKNVLLQKQVNEYVKYGGKIREIVEQVTEAVKAAEPYPMTKYVSGDLSSSPVEAVLKLSDWQIGEVDLASETEGFGSFDWEVAQNRVLDQLATNYLNWINVQRKAYSIDVLNLFQEGDFISGDIHIELQVTNEFPWPVQAVNAGTLLGEFTRRMAPHFKAVHLWRIKHDNHGRLTRKNQWAQGGLNNANHIVYAVQDGHLRDHKNIVRHDTEASKLLATAGGHRFLISHGHEVMGAMGIPFYGMERNRAREAVKRMNTKQTFHYQSIGHWHVASIISGNILVNGSLPGTTAFDHSQGRHASPAQVGFLVHPRHGMFNYVPWKFKATR